jgi:hypothetical protein
VKKVRQRGPWQRKVVAAAKDAGWRVRMGKKHILLYPPDGSRPYPLPYGTESESGRRQANAASYLRSKGLDV